MRYTFCVVPPPQPWEYHVGDHVFVSLRSDKATGRAVVISSPPPSTPCHPHAHPASPTHHASHNAHNPDTSHPSGLHAQPACQTQLQHGHPPLIQTTSTTLVIQHTHNTSHDSRPEPTSDPPTTRPTQYNPASSPAPTSHIPPPQATHPEPNPGPTLAPDTTAATPNPAQPPCTTDSTRYQVQYTSDTSTCWVRTERMIPVYPTDQRVLVCYSTTEYRRLARSQVCLHDRVAEVGSSYGVCTDILSQHCHNILGIDNSPQLVEEAKKRYPHVRFELADALRYKDRLTDLVNGCNKIFVDIGGNRQLESLVELLPQILDSARPDLVVVKSEQLFDCAMERIVAAGQTAGCGQPASQLVKGDEHGNPVRGGAAAAEGGGCGRGAGVRGEGGEAGHVRGGAGLNSSTSTSTAAASAQQCSSAATPPGDVPGCSDWWESLVARHELSSAAAVEPWFRAAREQGFRKNPMKYPRRNTPEGVGVCRPHNYNACYKADTCPFDHTLCHYCLQPGHRALDCPVGV